MRDVRLTNSNVQKIPKSRAGGSKKFSWDLMVRGFGAYRTASGRVSFVYQYKTACGRTTSSKIGEAGEMTVEEAREVAAGYARERRLGIDPFAKRRQREEEAEAERRRTIAAYFEEYLARRVVKGDPMSAKSERTYRRDMLPYVGGMRLDQLSRSDIEDFGSKLFERGPAVVRIGLGCLKTLINDAIHRGAIQRRDAFDFVLPDINRRKRRLDEAEFVRVYEAARDMDDVRADAFEMILRTAKRKEEVAELPWGEIDLARRQWKLPAHRNKSRRNVLILLPRQVVELLERVQPDPARRRGPVFSLDGKAPIEMGSQVKDLIDANLHRRLEAAAQGTGDDAFEHWTVHDMRKVPATVLREPPFRYSRDVVNAMLVHRVGDDLDETYMLTQLVEETGDALQRWNDHMDAMVSRPGAWPGGRHLPPMTPAERMRRVTMLRAHWPRRADQKRAERAAAEDPASAGGGGAAAARKRRSRRKKAERG